MCTKIGKGHKNKFGFIDSYSKLIYLTINTGIEDRRIIDIGGYTRNVHKIINKAIGTEIEKLNNKKCSKVIPILRKGVLDMEENFIVYKRVNPLDDAIVYEDVLIEDALKLLKNLYKYCVDNPKCKIKIS